MLTIYEERGILKGKRDALLKLLQCKFGANPPCTPWSRRGASPGKCLQCFRNCSMLVLPYV